MKYTHPNIVKAVLETLEGRRMMSSVSFNEGVLSIIGNAYSNNKVSVRLSSDGASVQASVNNSSPTHVALNQLDSIKIVGGEKVDVIQIDANVNVQSDIRGRGGNDWIFAGGGHDVINAGAGNDFIDARAGNDYVISETGDDRVYGGDGNDTLDSDGGNDTTLAGRGDDLIYGGDGNDHLDGKEGNDTVSAGQGNDRIFGAEGNDSLDGKEGSDTISGGAGADTFVNKSADDTVTDSDGDDQSTDNNSGGETPGGSGGDNTGGTDGGGNDTGGGDTGGGNTGGGDTGGGNTGGNTGGGDNTWDDSDDNTGEPGAPNPIISMLNGSAITGQAVHVNALKSTLGSGSVIDAKFEWNFGDEGGKYNVLRGFNAAHVYDKAGTYTITLKITDKNGKVAYETAGVSVAADTRKTIYVDAQGSDANAGTSPGAAVRSWERAKQLVGDNVKILFQRGDSFNVASTMSLDDSNVVIGAYGEGDRPTLSWSGSDGGTLLGMSSSASNVTIQGLSFATSGSAAPHAIKPQGSNITIRDNEFVSAFYGVNNNAKPTGVLIQDNVAPANGIRSYFVWVAGSDIVIVGNQAGNSVRESNVRMSQYERVLVANNTLREDDKATIVSQKGQYAYVVGNDVTNGPLTAGPLGLGDGLNQDPDYKTVRTRFVVFEGNRTHNAGITLVHGAEHVAIRDNVIERDKGAAITVDGYNSQYQRTVADVRIVNNTAKNDEATGNFLKTWGGNSGLVVKGNLYVAPNLTTGASSTAVVYVLAENLSGFAEISGNIWPTVTALSYANGGTHYVWSSWSDSDGYLDSREWENLDVVRGDVYQDVTLNFAAKATVSGVSAGSSLSLAA